MRVAITGASGMVGTALRNELSSAGDDVIRITRVAKEANDVEWDVAAGRLDGTQLEGIDAVFHLAGENIGEKRWTATQKARIRDSRAFGTRLLSETLARLERKPSVLVAASAIGLYGDRGDEILTESSSPGEGFLPDVCREWESATRVAQDAGIRVVNLRLGMVLSQRGGALKKMLLPFKLGVGGPIGNGRQYWSWISHRDAVRAILFAWKTPSLAGAVNAVADDSMTCIEFTRTLGRILHRPSFVPLPAFAARMALGEMADGLLLASARVVPQRLLDAGFVFEHAKLSDALSDELRRQGR